MWKPSDERSAEAVKVNLEDVVKSSSSPWVLCFFPFGILEKKTSQMALMIFGFKTFKLVVVTVSIYIFSNKREKCSDGSVLDEAGSLQSKCSTGSFLKSTFDVELAKGFCFFFLFFSSFKYTNSCLHPIYFCDSLADDCRYSRWINSSHRQDEEKGRNRWFDIPDVWFHSILSLN